MARPDACARRSSEIGEPIIARAGHTRLWILVEHPGPWPKSAPAGVLPDLLVERVDALTEPVRLVLIRRPRLRRVTEPRWILAWSDGVRHWMREGTVADHADLLDLPFETSAVGVEPDVGTSRSAPLFVVCTHGKKDACCAEMGRPIVTAASTVGDADVWECTHIGGDRFAANMIALPEGLYFSRLDADSAVATVRDHLAGRVSPAHLRGRAALSQPAQAAEHAVRVATGIDAVDAVERVDEDTTPDEVTTVDLRLASRDFRVVIRQGPAEQPFFHGCIPGAAATWRPWVVDSLDELSRSGG